MANWNVILGNSVATSGLSNDVITTISNGLIVAGEDWQKYFVTANETIEIRLEIADTQSNRSTGNSTSSVLIENDGQHKIFLDTAAVKLNSGSDDFSNVAEIVVTIDPDYLADVLYLDGSPLDRTTDIPIDRVDSQSVFLHEIGHGLGFNAFVEVEADLSTQLDLLVFDTFLNFQNGIPFFTGSMATSVYGANVPLTVGNIRHVGNDEPNPGSDLIPDLMNGVVFDRDFRYYISPLDTAILDDVGLVLKVPTEGADEIYGYENVDDKIKLLPGNDTFHGLSGNDTAKGGPGNDTLMGQQGDDVLKGQSGDDLLFGDDGNDKLNGGGGADVLNGGNGDDVLIGKAGDDVLNGGAGNDTLEGHKGSDTLDGGEGSDTYEVFKKDANADSYDDTGTGSGDIDILDATRVDALLLGTAFSAASSGIEVILGDLTRIVGAGATANWDFTGMTLTGISQVRGTTGNDSISGSAGNDKLLGLAGNDTVSGGDGDDVVKGNGGADVLSGGTGADRVLGGGGADVLNGDSGDDILKGGGGDDDLNGGDGNDRLIGGGQKDTFIFDTGLGSSNVDTIVKFNSADDSIDLDHDIFTSLTTLAGNALSASEFVVNTTGIAEEVDDRIIYNMTTGELFYDADGTGGGDGIQFAQLTNAPSIDADDFLVIS